MLDIASTLSALRDYDSQINTLWNIYVGVASLAFAAASTKGFRLHGLVLAIGFLVFAAGNASALMRFYEAQELLIEHGRSLPQQGDAISRLLSALKPPERMLPFHAFLDVIIAGTLFFISRKQNSQDRSE